MLRLHDGFCLKNVWFYGEKTGIILDKQSRCCVSTFTQCPTEIMQMKMIWGSFKKNAPVGSESLNLDIGYQLTL